MPCINNILPSSVEVRFPKTICVPSVDDTTDYIVNVPLTSVECSSSFSNALGFDGVKTFHETCPAVVMLSDDVPQNLVTLQAMANRIACDYYQYQSISHELVYNGVVPWMPTGLTDCVEFAYSADEISTRVVGKPVNGDPEELMHTDWSECPPGSLSTSVKITDVRCENNVLNVYGVNVTLSPSISGDQSLVAVSPEYLVHAAGCCDCPGPCPGSIRVPIVSACIDNTYSPTVTCVGPEGHVIPVSTGGGYYIVGLLDNAGVYTFTITMRGHYSRTVTFTGICGHQTTEPTIYLRPTSITISSYSLCHGMNGTVVTLGGVYSGSCSMADGGVIGSYGATCTIDVADLSGTGQPGDYTVTISQPRYVTKVVTYSYSTSPVTWTCNDSIYLDTLADCYVCCFPACNYPTTPTWLLSTPLGDITLSGLPATAFFDVLSHPAAPSQHPGCVSSSSCGCGLAKGINSVQFNVQWSCGNATSVPNNNTMPDNNPTVIMYYRACSDYYGSADTGNQFYGGFEVVWDSTNCNIPFMASGHISPYVPGPGVKPFYYVAGDYSISEIDCGLSGMSVIHETPTDRVKQPIIDASLPVPQQRQTTGCGCGNQELKNQLREKRRQKALDRAKRRMNE